MTKGYSQVKNRDSILRTTLLVIVCFLFLYPLQVPGLPFGTVMPMIGVFAFFTVYSLFKGKNNLGGLKTTRMVRSYWWWNVFLLVYVSFLLQIFGSGDGDTPIRDYIHMLIILPLFYISGNFIFRNIEELMKILYIGVIIQSIIIIIALFVPALTVALTLFFPEGSFRSDDPGGFEAIISEGYKIGLGVFSSAGCLRMAVGQIGACYFLIKSRGSKLYIHLFLYLMIAFATTAVARSGLIISVLGLIYAFIVKWKQGAHQVFKYLFIISFLLFVVITFITPYLPKGLLEDTFQRLIFTAENGLYDSYFRGYTGDAGTNVIPPISTETIIGLGITKGVSGSGVTTITDGGFLNNYSAMGLIVAIINYIIISKYFIKQHKLAGTFDYKGLILFISCVFLYGEFKQYFIYYTSPLCFAFLIFSLMEKEKKATYYIQTINVH